jgi:Domain of unknown function (DUF4157)
MPLAGLQRSKPTLKTRGQPKLAHAAIAHSTTRTTTLHPIVQARLRIGLQPASTCACDGSCPRCQSAVSGLEISQPNDSYEREADAVADRVMRMVGAASPVAPAEPVLQPKRATNEGEDDDEKLLQTKAGSSSPSAQSFPESSSARSSVHAALSVPGQPLAAETRAFFEPRFGRDLSGVRLHRGAAAERSAREISASAYTVGRDIVFGNGGLAPETPAGRWLMAHELAHVLQQGAGEVVRRFFIYAGGYPSPYKDEAEETGSIKAKTWMPWSRDFGYTAHTAGGGLGVKTIDELFGAIQEQGIHSITELGLIGHGAGGAIGFSGTVAFKPEATVTFADDGLITSESLLAESTARLYLNARDRFATGAVITLYACRSGTDQTFVENLSQAFGGVCVRAFKTGIDWCISSNPDGTIASRGWIRIGDSACQENIRSLTPDVASTSCGAAPAGGSTTEGPP